MRTSLSQMMGIARYEYRMHWRRRGLLVITLAMLSITLIAAFLTRHEMGNLEQIAHKREVLTNSILSLTFIPVAAVVGIIVPFIMADSVPRDKKLGVRELLDSTPVSPATYLAGKVLGGWLSLSVSVAGVVIATGLTWRLIFGPFDVLSHLEAWLVGGVSMIIINVGLTILLCASQPDVRRAILITVIFFVLLPGVIGFNPRGNLWDSFNPIRPGIFFYYANLVDTAQETTPILSVEMTIITGLAQLGLAWLVAWNWILRRTGHD